MTDIDKDAQPLPKVAAEYIDRVIKKMRYRKKTRVEVRAELTAHFADCLRDRKSDDERQTKACELIEGFGDAKVLAILIRRGKKRCRPMWKTVIVRSFQAVGAAILLFILYTVWFFMGRPSPSIDYIAILNEKVRPAVVDADNAWPHYERAIELYVEPDEELKELIREVERDVNDKMVVLTKAQAESISEWVKSNEPAWEEFVAGSAKPYYFREYTMGQDSQPDWLLTILLPHLSPLREIARMGARRQRLEVQKGRMAAAMDDCLAIVRSGGHLQGKGTLIEQLVGMSISEIGCQSLLEVLATSDLSADELKSTRIRLAAVFANGYPEVDIEGERFMLLDTIQHTFTEGGPGGGHIVLAAVQQLGEAFGQDLFFTAGASLIHAGRDATMAKANLLYDMMEDTTFTMSPYQRWTGDAISVDDFLEALPMYRYSLLEIMMPSIHKVSKTRYERKALYEAALTVLALKEYRLERGSYPESLEELVTAGLLDEVAMDPYSDGALRYERKADDFVLYSFGEDFDDDGGSPDPDSRHSWKDREKGCDRVFWPVW